MGDHDRHGPERPGWTCRVDGQDWPCGEARTRLTAMFATCPDVLTGHMLHLMVAAARDLNLPNESQLYWRFVTWTLPAGVRCRVCGSRGHDLLPGFPPRLTPWHKAHLSVMTTAADAAPVPMPEAAGDAS
jgi:hypothetical protein